MVTGVPGPAAPRLCRYVDLFVLEYLFELFSCGKIRGIPGDNDRTLLEMAVQLGIAPVLTHA
jgi:hypothetical protein